MPICSQTRKTTSFCATGNLLCHCSLESNATIANWSKTVIIINLPKVTTETFPLSVPLASMFKKGKTLRHPLLDDYPSASALFGRNTGRWNYTSDRLQGHGAKQCTGAWCLQPILDGTLMAPSATGAEDSEVSLVGWALWRTWALG